MSARDRFEERYRRTLAGTLLAALFVHRMPGKTVADRVARATAMTDALGVMRMGDWRPVFPYRQEQR